jgi:hypothetical protein
MIDELAQMQLFLSNFVCSSAGQFQDWSIAKRELNVCSGAKFGAVY